MPSASFPPRALVLGGPELSGITSHGLARSQLLGWRQRVSAGQARANLDPEARWFFYHSAQSFLNLLFISVFHQLCGDKLLKGTKCHFSRGQARAEL